MDNIADTAELNDENLHLLAVWETDRLSSAGSYHRLRDAIAAADNSTKYRMTIHLPEFRLGGSSSLLVRKSIRRKSPSCTGDRSDNRGACRGRSPAAAELSQPAETLDKWLADWLDQRLPASVCRWLRRYGPDPYRWSPGY